MKHFIAFLFIIFFFGCNRQSEVAKLESEKMSLISERDSLLRLQAQFEATIDSLQINNNQLKSESNVWFNNKTDGKTLLEKGIENPRAYIINTFTQRTELIPVKPVLGGQMRFMHVILLGKGCLIAYYEDGHINGKALYNYVLEDGGLKFKLIRTCAE